MFKKYSRLYKPNEKHHVRTLKNWVLQIEVKIKNSNRKILNKKQVVVLIKLLRNKLILSRFFDLFCTN